MRCSAKSLALMVIALSPCAFCQGGLLGRKSPDGKIHFQAVEELQIDGSHRVRLMPATARQVTPEEARKFPREELAQAGTIRMDAAHRLVRLDDAGRPSDVILPDNFSPKTPVDAASAQGVLNIQAIESRRAKTGEPVPPEQFFIFVPGAEADKLAYMLLGRTSVFLNADEQLAAMEGFVVSFPDSPMQSDLRAVLRDHIAGPLDAFENHGAYADVLASRPYAEFIRRVLPGDQPLRAVCDRFASRIQFVESTRLKLSSLAAAGQWDVFLDAYQPFEHYQWSFPEMMALRQTAFEESARLHAHRARLLAERQEQDAALAEFALAARRDPDNRATIKLLEATRVVGSLAHAQGAKPRVLPAGSPEDLRFRRSVHDAERSIQDKDYSKAEAAIQEAQGENKEAPEILVLQAKLLAARDRHAEALPLLDTYDRTVSDPAARELGNTARNDILYDLEKKRTGFRQQLDKLQHDGEYSKLRAATAQALTLDPDDDGFLYYGGVSAALFRDATARDRLERYLAKSNSLRGDPEARDRAFRILGMLDAPAPAKSSGTPNWLSGRPLADGVVYCPLSGAFQLPIDSVAGYKLKMAFLWDGARLNGISTNFDDDKGAQNYHSLGGPDGSPGVYFFGYGRDGQVQTASTRRPDPPVAQPELHVVHDASTPPHLVDEHGLPRLLFCDSSQFNAAALTVLEGPLSTGVAGNSVFNPFIWDGLHYFSLTYDASGRLATAKEWNADNLVRFAWSGERLTEVRAYRGDSALPYYQRSISYSGAGIAAEQYSQGNKVGQIKYVYSGKVLQQAKVEDGGVHDGKTWTVRFR